MSKRQNIIGNALAAVGVAAVAAPLLYVAALLVWAVAA